MNLEEETKEQQKEEVTPKESTNQTNATESNDSQDKEESTESQPSKDPQEPTQAAKQTHKEEEGIQFNKSTVERIEKLLLESEKTNRSLNQKIDNLRASHMKELEEIKSSLPKFSYDDKVKVEGYYDWDFTANKLVSERAEQDYLRAKKDFQILKNKFS